MILALVVGGCSSQPALTLVVDGLASARALRVTLSSPKYAFHGEDTVDGATRVRYQDDGTIRIDLDPATREMRLGLRSDQTYPLDAVATATLDGGEISAATSTNVAPGQDATLRFTFAPLDLGAPDLATADLATVDLATGDLAMPDLTAPIDLAGVDQPPPDLTLVDLTVADDLTTLTDLTAPADLTPVTCSVPKTVAASAAAAGSGPSLAWSGQYWGLAWVNAGNAIEYNSLDLTAATVLQNATDQALFGPTSGVGYRNTRLWPSGTSFALAFGVKTNTTSPGPTLLQMAVIQAKSGSPKTTAQATNTTNDTTAPEVGGVAVSSGGVLLAAGRSYVGPSQVRLDRFTSTPTYGGESAPSALSGTYAVSSVWAATASTFGVAYVTASTASGGSLVTCDTTGNCGTAFAFTGANDKPVTASVPGVAVASDGSNFGVAWADGQSGTPACSACASGSEIFFTIVPATGAARTGEVHVSTMANVAGAPKRQPRVAWDGASWIVAWVETKPASTDAVWMQRFDGKLNPIGAAVNVSAASPNAPGGNEIGLAVESVDHYGLAWQQQITGTLELASVTCSGH